MLRRIPFFLLSSLWLLPTILLPAFAQEPSILNIVMMAQPAIVTIEANTTGLYKSPQAAAIDKKTGRIIMHRKLKAASYSRQGAGVLVHPSGIIVTNAHNVNKANSISVIFHDQSKSNAQVFRVVNDLDIAFLKVDLPYPIQSVELADSNKVRLGDEVVTVGNSAFLKQTITGGKIKGIGTSRTIKRYGGKRTDLIQTTINLYEGDSGGPLFDKRGRLIGLMTAKETAADHSSFAIPSNKIKKYLWEYLRKTKIEENGQK